MRYFLDTEFNERGLGRPLELISIALVDEQGDSLYRVNAKYNDRHANPWVRENVLPLLPPRWTLDPDIPLVWAHPTMIALDIKRFVHHDDVEFWGYYSDYDYVLLSQIMGGMSKWPSHWPYYCRDLRQWLDDRGLQHVKQDDNAPHDALKDAQWVRDTYLTHALQPV